MSGSWQPHPICVTHCIQLCVQGCKCVPAFGDLQRGRSSGLWARNSYRLRRRGPGSVSGRLRGAIVRRAPGKLGLGRPEILGQLAAEHKALTACAFVNLARPCTTNARPCISQLAFAFCRQRHQQKFGSNLVEAQARPASVRLVDRP